jgi:hypothetical protein
VGGVRGRVKVYTMGAKVSMFSIKTCQRRENEGLHERRQGDLVEGGQVAVGEGRKKHIFLEIITALIQIKHNALKLHLHRENSRRDEPPDTETILFAFVEACALLHQRCEKP